MPNLPPLVHRDSLPPDPELAVRGMVARMPGRRLPPERELSLQLGVSRPRLRMILASLQAEGLVESRQGSGTYAVAAGPTTGLRQVAILADHRLKLGEDPFFGHLIECLQNALQAEGIACLIARVRGEDASPPISVRGGTDGLLTIGLAGQPILTNHRPEDPPLVALLLGADARPGRRASVYHLADREAGADAARFLLEQGCGALVFAGRDDLPVGRERHTGAEETAAAAGVGLHLLTTGLNYAAGLAAAPALAALLASLTNVAVGVIAANDWLAVGLRAGLRAQSGPEVSLVSFDGLPITGDPSLGIRSLAVPVATIAADAVSELQRLRRSPTAIGRGIWYPLG